MLKKVSLNIGKPYILNTSRKITKEVIVKQDYVKQEITGMMMGSTPRENQDMRPEWWHLRCLGN